MKTLRKNASLAAVTEHAKWNSRRLRARVDAAIAYRSSNGCRDTTAENSAYTEWHHAEDIAAALQRLSGHGE